MRNILHKLRTFSEGTAGAVTVEFVIGMPVLLATMLLSYEFGAAILAFEVANYDVQSAVRFLSHGGTLAQAENIAECGTPASCSASAMHFPWNWNTSSPPTFSETTPYSLAYNSANSGLSFNANVSAISLQANIPVSLPFLAFFGISTAYTISVSNQALLVGS
jgi:Flp pilus assembly protein TadG